MPRLSPVLIDVGAHVLVRAALRRARRCHGGHPERAPAFGASRGICIVWILGTEYWVLISVIPSEDRRGERSRGIMPWTLPFVTAGDGVLGTQHFRPKLLSPPRHLRRIRELLIDVGVVLGF